MPEDIVTKMEIDLDNLIHNYHELDRGVGRAQIIPVVKSEAYGHGAVPIAKELERVGCQHFAVAMVNEGIQLRQAGIEGQIMLLGVTLPQQFPAVAEYKLTPTLGNYTSLRAWSQLAQKTGLTLGFHLKVDVGLGRLGFLPDEVAQVLALLQETPAIQPLSISSHLSQPEGRQEKNAEELKRYQSFCRPFLKHYPQIKLHLAASEAVLRYPHMYFDWVRLGGLLYGFDYDYPTSLNLKPVLAYKSQVGQIKTLPAGWNLFYGEARQAKEAIQVALVPLGWSDGLSKPHLYKAGALIRGQFAPLVGICTDFTLFDISSLAAVKEGDEVVLVGSQDQRRQTIMQLSRAGNMSASELLGSASLRVPRLYYQGGKLVAKLALP